MAGSSSGPARKPILKGEASMELVLPPKRERRARGRGRGQPGGDPLFEALRAKRRELAEEAGLPPYVIFHDATLREMAAATGEPIGDGGNQRRRSGEAGEIWGGVRGGDQQSFRPRFSGGAGMNRPPCPRHGFGLVGPIEPVHCVAWWRGFYCRTPRGPSTALRVPPLQIQERN